ncbi:hypothetical protein [Clostridioides sp. ZZV14-6387]|uniref:hypothetical protein n=1 Tax=Clostridioides sp. ZZV14-6387 TaxID=2811497 RepID=UPI001D113396|nr:hypothetical protein [Clostridioides sp. ZZV14-6387]
MNILVSFSCWTLNNKLTIEQIAERILDTPNRQISDNYSINFSKILDFDKDNVTVLSILDKEIKCIFFKLSPVSTEQHSLTDIDVLIYEFNNDVYINAFRGHQTSQKLLKQYFNKDTWGELQNQRPDIGEDLLYWMFKSFLDKSPKSPLDSGKSLYLTSLKRYRGSTKDLGNTLTGEGDRITKILGTLAFLLNNNLKLLKNKVTYSIGGIFHSLVLEIQLTGTIRFDQNYYTGDFKRLGNLEKLNAAISILIIKIIIPIIVQSYQESIINAEWSPALKRDFIKRIAEDIKERVDIEIEKLDKSIPKLAPEEVDVNKIQNLSMDEVATDLLPINNELDMDDIDMDE